MRKLISILLALIIAMFAVPSLAEEQQFAMTGEFGINISEEGLAVLSQMQGESLPLEEEQLKTVLELINNLKLRGVVADRAAQLDILLKDTEIASVAAKKEKGDTLYVVSDLVPYTFVSASDETIKQLKEQLMEQINSSSQNAIQNIDPEELVMAVLPHLQTAGEAVMAKVGDPETVTYTFEETEFTSKIPVNLTTKEIAVIGLTAVRDILAEEALAPIIQAAEGFDPSELDEKIKEIQEKPDEELPVSDIGVYSNENGDFLLGITLTKDNEQFSLQAALVTDKAIIKVAVNDQMNIDAVLDMSAMNLTINAAINADGISMGLDLIGQLTDNGFTADLKISFNGAEVISMSGSIITGGEVTVSFETADKTEVRLEDIMQGGEEAMNLLMNDFQNNMMNLLIKVMQVIPEVGTLLGSGT